MGCTPASAPLQPCPAPPPPPATAVAVAPAVAATPDVPKGPPLNRCEKGMKPAPQGLFDDFEDGNNQVALVDGRSGYWWTAHAPHAVLTVPGSEEFRVADGGPPGSKKAAHVAGKTDVADVWGAALGGNFLGGGFYDASKYDGISFKLKGKAKEFVRFKVLDIAAHPDGGLCTKDCWNAFGKTLQFTGDWQTIELSFADLTQMEGWGSPRPPYLSKNKLKHLEWAVEQGVEFDFWVDDVQLLVCN